MSNNSAPFFSVVIAVYNREKLLPLIQELIFCMAVLGLLATNWKIVSLEIIGIFGNVSVMDIFLLTVVQTCLRESSKQP